MWKNFKNKIICFFVNHKDIWDFGYGFVKGKGLGSYEFKTCSRCAKIHGNIRNFERDTSE